MVVSITLWWTNSLQLKMAIEIVSFPIKNGDFPWQNVSSPEGSLVIRDFDDLGVPPWRNGNLSPSSAHRTWQPSPLRLFSAPHLSPKLNDRDEGFQQTRPPTWIYLVSPSYIRDETAVMNHHLLMNWHGWSWMHIQVQLLLLADAFDLRICADFFSP